MIRTQLLQKPTVLNLQQYCPYTFSLSGGVNVKPHIITSSEIIFNCSFQIIFVRLNLDQLILKSFWLWMPQRIWQCRGPSLQEKSTQHTRSPFRWLPAWRMSPLTIRLLLSHRLMLPGHLSADITNKPCHSLPLFSIEVKCTISISTFWPRHTEMTRNGLFTRLNPPVFDNDVKDCVTFLPRQP